MDANGHVYMGAEVPEEDAARLKRALDEATGAEAIVLKKLMAGAKAEFDAAVEFAERQAALGEFDRLCDEGE